MLYHSEKQTNIQKAVLEFVETFNWSIYKYEEHMINYGPMNKYYMVRNMKMRALQLRESYQMDDEYEYIRATQQYTDRFLDLYSVLMDAFDDEK